MHSDYLNNIALGICLVGDFNRDQPTRAQLEGCEELIRYLRLRCGKIDAHYAIVRPHREMNSAALAHRLSRRCVSIQLVSAIPGIIQSTCK